jgi:quercetin dioxygenase-like cupin family protein
MKQIKFFVALQSFCLISFAARSQDFSSTNPNLVKVLGDTLNARLLLFTIPPGVTTSVHTHPSSIIYALEGGTIKVEYANGKIETITLTTGQSIQAPPEPPHKTTNIGKTTIKTIEVEISK